MPGQSPSPSLQSLRFVGTESRGFRVHIVPVNGRDVFEMYRCYKIEPWKGPWIKDDINKARKTEQDNG